jgi:hypothetical protein
VVDLDFLDYVIKWPWFYVLSLGLYNLHLQHIENETYWNQSSQWDWASIQNIWIYKGSTM